MMIYKLASAKTVVIAVQQTLINDGINKESGKLFTRHFFMYN